MKIHRIITATIAGCLAMSAWSAAPNGYYSSLNGKKDSELKTAAYNLVRNFTTVSSYTALPEYFKRTDVRPGTNYWWDMYSDMDVPTNITFGKYMNREHSFPKSWWGGSTSVTAYVDLNHLYPGEAKANQAKSNYPLGTVDTSAKDTFNNGVTKVGYPVNGQGGGAKYVFEPADEYKGDFARTYFYMVTCYQDLKWSYTYMLNQNTYPTLNQWSINLLLKWHREDPVSQKEIQRNEQVYQIQNNRNPFIDLPELAEYIWGKKVGESFTPGSVIVTPTGEPELTAPVKDMALDFGEVALGDKTVSRLLISGKDLGGTIRVQFYTGNSTMFTAPVTQIPASQVCSSAGYWLDITYAPTEIGEHTSKILLSGDFGSRAVSLHGNCLPSPTLTACTATAPSDIEADRYTANWTAPATEVIDYFVVTRTRYTGGDAITEEILAENEYALITGFDQSESESYSVQSVRLNHRSPMSNVVFVDHTGISGVSVSQPLVIHTFPGCIRFICSERQTGCRIFDTMGRLVMMLDSVEQNMDVDMAGGIYFIITDQHPTPVKVTVRY